MGGSILTQILSHHPERVATAIYGGSGVIEVDPAWVERVPDDPQAPEGMLPEDWSPDLNPFEFTERDGYFSCTGW
jgi:pimeloyl-ACP methyl ester carboxylesterase